jgi:hypothetical protein
LTREKRGPFSQMKQKVSKIYHGNTTASNSIENDHYCLENKKQMKITVPKNLKNKYDRFNMQQVRREITESQFTDSLRFNPRSAKVGFRIIS